MSNSNEKEKSVEDFLASPEWRGEQFALFQTALLNAVKHMHVLRMNEFDGAIHDIHLKGYKVRIAMEKIE